MVDDVAGSAEQLHGVRGDLHCGVGGEGLRGGTEVGEILVAAFALGGGGVGELTCGLELHAHIGEHELDRLVIGDRLSELLTILDVGQGVVERALSDADGLRGDRDSGVVEGAQGDLQPLPGLADDAVTGQADVVEEELSGGRALDAELALLLAEGEALIGLLDDEGGDVASACSVGVGHGHHRVVLGLSGVGDPGLDPVEDPVVAVAFGAGLHRCGVGSGFALGQTVGEACFTCRYGREVLLLDLFAAAELDRHAAELVHGRNER